MLDTSRTQTEAGPKISLSLSSLIALAATLLWSKYRTCNPFGRGLKHLFRWHAVSSKLYYATIYWYVYRYFGLIQPFFAELTIRDAHTWCAHCCCSTIRNSHPKIVFVVLFQILLTRLVPEEDQISVVACLKILSWRLGRVRRSMRPRNTRRLADVWWAIPIQYRKLTITELTHFW